MSKSTFLDQSRIFITHNKGECHAEWLVGVQKQGSTYSVYGTEYKFSHIDNDIILAIFSPYKDAMRAVFHEWYDQGLLTSNATWTQVGSVNTYLSGIKSYEVALEIANHIENLVTRTLRSIAKDDLDRDLLLAVDVKIVAIDKAREFSYSIQDEIINNFKSIDRSMIA